MIDEAITLAAVARPGDTVMIGLSVRMGDEELGHLIDEFEGFTESTGVHIALIEGVSSMVVVRPEGGDGD